MSMRNLLTFTFHRLVLTLSEELSVGKLPKGGLLSMLSVNGDIHRIGEVFFLPKGDEAS